MVLYTRDTRAEAEIARVSTLDEAQRVAVHFAKLPGLLSGGNSLGATGPS